LRAALKIPDPPSSTLVPYTTLFRSEEYARAVGLEVTELTPQIFAAYPVMLRIGGEYFVRSIQKANPDGSLTFYCAIDTGLVLTVDRKSTRLNSSHVKSSYAVFCLKK